MEKENPFSNDDELLHTNAGQKTAMRRAETELFKRYSFLIRQGMNKYSLEREDAFTAYSDTILQSLDNIAASRFQNHSSLKTYLYQIFKNKCVDLIRKKTTKKQCVYQTSAISEMMDMISDKAKNIVQKLVEENDIELLRKRLREIGNNCRKMLLLFADGYSDKEIAAMMEYKTAQVVKTSRLRCIEKLRILYSKKEM